MKIIGIDPGCSGGIAYVNGLGGFAAKMPETERDIWELIKEFVNGADVAYIEAVHSMPKQGVSSSFKFGQSYGLLRAFLIASGVRFEQVTPQKWQKEFGLTRKSKDESITDKKNRHKAVAQQLFPDLKLNHKTADALLIAEYGRRIQ